MWWLPIGLHRHGQQRVEFFAWAAYGFAVSRKLSTFVAMTSRQAQVAFCDPRRDPTQPPAG
ncbi:hypothetical protein MCHLDSM_05823 [Mycolicibacterium chlorophenolicum]|uniref:Uncharacterized protein n=1 Tax=Mycolicibacterium chlorophenolicum TaxID=37916 RepID=A0A0J6VL14_9MYCO|nr:hypothetical protein MCHLDSM_05823 [Mycolicibacterium chlorophenolicum]